MSKYSEKSHTKVVCKVCEEEVGRVFVRIVNGVPSFVCDIHKDNTQRIPMQGITINDD